MTLENLLSGTSITQNISIKKIYFNVLAIFPLVVLMKNQITKVNLFSFLILIVICIGLLTPLIISNGFLILRDSNSGFYNNFSPFDFINLVFLGIPSFLVLFALAYVLVNSKRNDTEFEDEFEVL
ncbi:MAG: hypothetical protein ACXACX_02645 [Candidatus Hodarchaeales archaeon]